MNASASPISRTGSPKRHAFVVDDEPQVRTFVSNVLTAQGFKPHQFSSGPEVEAALSEWSPQLIVLDLSLGDSDAVEVIRMLADVHFRRRRPADQRPRRGDARGSASDRRRGAASACSSRCTSRSGSSELRERLKAVHRDRAGALRRESRSGARQQLARALVPAQDRPQDAAGLRRRGADPPAAPHARRRAAVGSFLPRPAIRSTVR